MIVDYKAALMIKVTPIMDQKDVAAFVEEDHVIHQFFLPGIYAVGIPLAAGFMLLAGLGRSLQ
jgi:hypothetical protein